MVCSLHMQGRVLQLGVGGRSPLVGTREYGAEGAGDQLPEASERQRRQRHLKSYPVARAYLQASLRMMTGSEEGHPGPLDQELLAVAAAADSQHRLGLGIDPCLPPALGDSCLKVHWEDMG